jgi:hypothetical protein
MARVWWRCITGQATFAVTSGEAVLIFFSAYLDQVEYTDHSCA